MSEAKQPRGRYGPVGWIEHEVDNWVHGRVRAGTKMAVLPPPETPAKVNVIRFPEVHKRTSLSRWSIWDLERRGLFPRHVLLRPQD